LDQHKQGLQKQLVVPLVTPAAKQFMSSQPQALLMLQRLLMKL
tara:strand:- start:281 stop:409 length:129 start_codon:yes stop_codon:yes gene_type:complete